jgi:polyisoprenoid-binding protein YceI
VFISLSRRHAAAAVSLALLAACGTPTSSQPAAGVATDLPAVSAPQSQPSLQSQPAQPAAATQKPAAATQSQQPSLVQAPAGALVFQIVPGQSKATFRVREQLAGRDLPNDAVGTTSAVTGQLAIQPDGTLLPDASKITVDITSLATDQSMRDQFIKFNTLQTRQYPTAEFAPTKVQGLPAPLPDSGQYTFKLTGLMTIHGVQKEITWDVTASRDGASLTGTATTAFKFGDFGMTPPKAPAVLSVVDDIRLEASLAASAAA